MTIRKVQCNHRGQLTKDNQCPECLDDELERKTGCRFGDATEICKSNHMDCYQAKLTVGYFLKRKQWNQADRKN